MHFLAHVTNAATGEELATIEPVWAAVGAPAGAVEVLRDRLMTTLATLTDPLLAKWARYASRPPNFEAYTEFVAGIELYTKQKKYREAIPHLLRAAELDSSFTMPSLWAGMAYHSAFQWALADSLAEALDRRREPLTRLDRDFLDYLSASLRRDQYGALEAMRRFVEIAPGSYYLMLAATAALDVSRPREAVELLSQADPESGWFRGREYWSSLAWAYHLLGDYERELEASRRGRRQYPDQLATLGMRALAALGRVEEVHQLLDEGLQHSPLRANPHFGDKILGVAHEFLRHGHRTAASDVFDRAIQWLESAPTEGNEHYGYQRVLLARVISMDGRLDEARAILERLTPEDLAPGHPDEGRLLVLALVLARQGDRAEAVRISRVLAERERSETRPNDRALVIYWRAMIAAAPDERERAIALLREAIAANSYLQQNLHAQGGFESLWDYPPFQELYRPKG